jgi:hypothetical protein
MGIGWLRTLAVGLFMTALTVPIAAYDDTTAAAATVNSELVCVRELQRSSNASRAAVFQYFHQKYGAVDDKAFWVRRYGSERPRDVLVERALAQCVSIKLQQVLARQAGIWPDITYRAFLESLARENARRKAVVGAGGVIYGPVEYGEDEYFAQTMRVAVIALQEKLSEREPAIPSMDLERFYEENKDQLFRQPSGSYERFEDVKDVIRGRIVEQTYDRLVEDLIKLARVEVNRRNCRRIRVR